MYVPKFFKITDMNEIVEFINAHSFAIMVTTENSKPIATHLPLQLKKLKDDYYVTGHLAYGNPQWRILETSKEVLVIYQGPHAYISSSWYGHENVPTWNYQSVHLYGEASILSEEELKQDLASLLEKYEKHRENAVLWDKLSPELIEREIKGIVGFKIKVVDIQAAYKMSQNRNSEDYHKIIEKLAEENNVDSQMVAEAMKKLNKGDIE